MSALFPVVHSVGSHFGFVAACATVDGYQFAFLDIKLLRLVDHPFMVAVATQRIASMLFLKRGLFERENIGHG
jgi:hypothetical protein